MECVLPEEAASNQNHAERIAFLEKEIKAVHQKRLIGILCMAYGFILFAFLYGYMYCLAGDIEEGATFFVPAILLRELVGLNLYIEAALLLVGVGLSVFGFYTFRHAGKADLLEQELTKILFKRNG